MQNNIEQLSLNFPALGAIDGSFGFLLIAATVVLHVLFAGCVLKDAHLRVAKQQPVIILTCFTWALAALMLGLIAVAFYWLCHYSRFYRKES
jgi:hypothetical protein